MLDDTQMDRWRRVNTYLEEALSQVNNDPTKTRKIQNIRSKLAWALDQYESGLATRSEIVDRLNTEVAEKFQEILGQHDRS